MTRSKIQTYVARPRRAGAVVGAALTSDAPASSFDITVRFLGGLTDTQKDAFKKAADRWTRVIVGQLPPVQVDGELVTGLLITASGEDIDGPGQILGQAGPTHLRPAGAGPAAFLPAKGTMAFDTADLAKMEADGTLNDVIAHEMGHVIGIGTVWTNKDLLEGVGSTNPTFAGPAAMDEFGKLRNSGPVAVPVENSGGAGTRDSHWRETVFANELMTGFVGAAGNPLSRMTIASLKDMGYTVDMSAAEPYSLPDLAALAVAGHLAPHAAPINGGIVLGSVPMTLPEDALR